MENNNDNTNRTATPHFTPRNQPRFRVLRISEGTPMFTARGTREAPHFVPRPRTDAQHFTPRNSPRFQVKALMISVEEAVSKGLLERTPCLERRSYHVQNLRGKCVRCKTQLETDGRHPDAGEMLMNGPGYLAATGYSSGGGLPCVDVGGGSTKTEGTLHYSATILFKKNGMDQPTFRLPKVVWVKDRDQVISAIDQSLAFVVAQPGDVVMSVSGAGSVDLEQCTVDAYEVVEVVENEAHPIFVFRAIAAPAGWQSRVPEKVIRGIGTQNCANGYYFAEAN